MQSIAIITLIIVCVFSIIQMINAKAIIKGNWYKSLDRECKIKVISILKMFWKKNIIVISLMIGISLIISSTFMGRAVSYDYELSIVAIIIAIISTIIIIRSKKDYDNKVSEFK